MMGYTALSIILSVMCLPGAAYAQSAYLIPGLSRDAAWINVDLDETISATQAGLHILAQNAGDSSPSTLAVGWHRDGIGAAGAQASAPAIKAETGYDPVLNRSEQIIILFDQPVMRTDIDVTYFYRGEGKHGDAIYHERGGWRAYRGETETGQGLFLPESEGGAHLIMIRTREPFDRLELFATPYVREDGTEIAPGLITTDSSDFLIKRIAYRPVHEIRAGH